MHCNAMSNDFYFSEPNFDFRDSAHSESEQLGVSCYPIVSKERLVCSLESSGFEKRSFCLNLYAAYVRDYRLVRPAALEKLRACGVAV